MRAVAVRETVRKGGLLVRGMIHRRAVTGLIADAGRKVCPRLPSVADCARALSLCSVLLLACAACLCAGGEGKSCYRVTEQGVFLRYYGGYPRAEVVMLRVKGADAASFRHLEGSREGDCQGGHSYARDGRYVYYRITPLRGADPETFTPLRYGYSKDMRGVFYREGPVPGADAKTFRVIENFRKLPYGADRHGVVHGSARVRKDIDGNTFEILHRPYFRDSRRVYFGREYAVLAGADPASFTWQKSREIVNDIPYAFDRRRAYYFEKGAPEVIEDIDRDSFIVLGRNYAKDRYRVYFKASVVEGADPGTFRVPDRKKPAVGQDRHRRYLDGKTLD